MGKMRYLISTLAVGACVFFGAAPVRAQNMICPTPPSTDISNRCASTAFVSAFAAGSIPLPNGDIFIGNASNLATAHAMSADGSIAASGAFTLQAIQGNTVAGTTGTGNVVFSAAPTFSTSWSLLGSSTGATTFASANAGASNFTLTFPAVTDTVAGKALANGGTNAALTASNGGIVYSSASALAILAGTATANQMLMSGATATPVWSTATWPTDVSAAGQILNSSAAHTWGATATPTLGASGTTGTLAFGNATSGTVTLNTVTGALGSVTASLPANTGTIAETNLAQTWSAVQTFQTNDFVLTNATSGQVTVAPVSGALGTVTASLPANTGTIAELNLAQTWSAVQTFNNSDIKLLGSSSGATTFTSANAGASNFTLTFPAVTDTLAGLALANGGSNAALTASNGGIVWSNASQMQILAGTATANQMLMSGATATPAWSTATWPTDVSATGQILNSSAAHTWGATATPTLGASGTSGSLAFGNATSGTVTLNTVTGALGSVTASLPANTGTIAELNLAQNWTANQQFGVITLNTGTQLSSATMTMAYNGASANGAVINDTASTNGSHFYFFEAATIAIGSITNNNNTGTAFNTSSDARLKENVTPTSSGLATLMQIPVADFNFISDPTHRIQGFVAQSLRPLYPEAVTANGDDGVVPLDATATPWQVDYGRLTPLIIRAVQELKADNDNLRAEIEDLKRRVH